MVPLVIMLGDLPSIDIISLAIQSGQSLQAVTVPLAEAKDFHRGCGMYRHGTAIRMFVFKSFFYAYFFLKLRKEKQNSF